jgi:AcrR family transcriptional regulator
MKNVHVSPSAKRQRASRPVSVIDHPSDMRFVPSTPRERILFTALELIAEQGFRGFSLNRVIQRGGYSKGAVFHHFRNLDDLCLACYDLIRVFMLPRIDASSFTSMRDFLLAFGAQTLKATQTRHYFAMVYFFAELAMTNPVFQKAQRELTEYYQSSLVAELRKLADPAADEELLRDLVAYMSIVLDGVAGHRLMFDDPERMQRIWPLVVESVTSALTANPGVQPGRAPRRRTG